MKKIIIIILVLVVAALGYKAFSQYRASGTISNPFASVTPPANTVYIQSGEFEPDVLTVAAGTMVTWVNKDNVPHTVKADSGNGVSSPTLDPGESFTYTFSAPSTVGYHCNIHRAMKASVVVN